MNISTFRMVLALGVAAISSAAIRGDDVVVVRDGMPEGQARLGKTIMTSKDRVMNGSGLAGAMGGVQLRIVAANPQEILLPIPQRIDGQVPLCFFINSTPPDAVSEFRIRKRDDSNVIISVRLSGKPQEVRLEWSAIVLLAPRNFAPDATAAEPYRQATACVQSGAEEITKRTGTIWPVSGKAGDYAANIQRHIRELKRVDRPRSLDAVGIVRSGESGICTANANLAAALMRSRGIAARSIAVIPPISRRLEMHRIVEYVDGGRWQSFDPSSLQADIPCRPWQNIIIAKTTPQDEAVAMKPRMGVMVGSPYGQEVELLTPGVALFGQDFFWTLAKPIAEFDVDEMTFRTATAEWNRFLEKGVLSKVQQQTAAARTAADLAEALRAK